MHQQPTRRVFIQVLTQGYKAWSVSVNGAVLFPSLQQGEKMLHWYCNSTEEEQSVDDDAIAYSNRLDSSQDIA